MLNNFLITCNIMLPLVIYLVLGAGGRRVGIFGEDFKASTNRFLNNLLLPLTAFNSIYKADLAGLRSGSISARYAGIATIVFIFLMMFAARLIEKDPKKKAAIVHCSIRGNTMLYALPIATALYGADNVGELVVVMAVVLTIYNIAFILVLEYYRSFGDRGAASGSTLSMVKEGLISCAKNKILQGIVLGFILNAFHVKFPSFLQTAVTNLANMTVPMSFILMGVRLNMEALKSNSRNVVIATAVKLVIMPALVIILPLIWGWSGKTFASVFLCFSTSSAVTSYATTEALGGDGELAGEIVMVSAVFSAATLFLWIFCFKQFGLI